MPFPSGVSLASDRCGASLIIAVLLATGLPGNSQTAAPSITEQPTSLTVTVGEVASFNVAAEGTAPLLYQWRFNWVDLPGATSNTLVLPSSQLADTGVYSVRVSNAAGSVLSADAALSVQPVLPCAPLPSGAVAWWRGEDNDLDSVGLNDGLSFNTMNEVYDAGRVGKAFRFYYYYKSFPASPSLDVGTGPGLTVEGWILDDNPTFDFDPLLQWNSGRSVVDAGLMLDGTEGPGALQAVLSDAAGVSHVLRSAPGVVITGAWQHVAMTFAKASGELTLFANGAVVATTNIGPFTPLTVGDLYMARHAAGPHTGQTLRGRVDETAIYGRALSPAEIQAIHAAGDAGKCPPPPAPCLPPSSSLVAWWKGEGDAHDQLLRNDAQAFNLTYREGRIGQAFDFFQSGRRLTVPASFTINGALAGGFTVEFWMNQQAAIFGPLVEWNDSSSDPRVSLEATSPSGEVLAARLVDGAGQKQTMVTAANTIRPGAWQHIAFTYDRATGLGAIYVNGQAAVTKNLGSFYPATVGNLFFGERSGGTGAGGTFFGWLDELSLHSRALTTGEIQAIHRARARGKCPQTTPLITAQPTDVTVILGGPATFTVAALGMEPLSYQWRFQGNNLNGATNAGLILNSVRATDAGRYSVEVANYLGSVTSSNAQLAVTLLTNAPAPPSIVIPPQHQTVYAGGTAAFSVQSGGYPLPSYQWRFNDAPLVGATLSQLILHNLQPSQAGRYSVTLTNPLGSITSTTAVLRVLGYAPTIVAQPQSQTAYEGSNATFSATVAGTPPFTYQWSFNGTPLGDATNAALMVAQVQPSQAGAYSVQVTNSYGYAASSNAWLSVTGYPPAIVAQPQSATNNAGDTVRFSVTATGTPRLGYQWLLNGTPLAGATSTALILTSVQTNQNGLYAAVITNAYGTASSSNAQLSVIGLPPVITGQPTNMVVFTTESATLRVAATGSPPLRYQWYFAGTALTGATNSTFSRANTQTNDGGRYSATVSNLYGVATSSNALLTVIEPVCVNAPTGAVAWWRAENNCFDAVSMNDGIPSTTPSSLFGTGKVGTGFSFGTSTYHVRVPASPELDVGTGAGMTIEGWIRPTSMFAANSILEWNDGRGNAGVRLALANNGAAYYLFANLKDTQQVAHGIQSTSAVPTLAWQHVAVTYDKASGVAALYLNGVPAAGTNFGALTLETRTNLYLGVSLPSGSGPVVWRGGLDEFTLYQRALTAVEIQSICSADRAGKCFTPRPCVPIPDGLVSWWQAESNALDRVGLNHGLPATAPASSFGAGLVGMAFKPTANFVRVPASPSLDVGRGPGFTYEVWLNPANTYTMLPIAEWNNGTGSTGALGVNLVAFPLPNLVALEADLVDTNGVSHVVRAPWNTLTNGLWQHVALTYDQTAGLAALYVNGNPVALTNVGRITARTGTNFYLGYRPAGPSAPRSFSGSMDEPALYRRALAAEEVRALYRAREAGKCPVVFPPSIQRQPADALADVGEGAFFAGTFSGTQPMRYQWLHDGVPLPQGTNATLLLTNIQFADAGSYVLSATNPAGMALSLSATLTVPVPGPCLTPPPGLLAWWRGEGDGIDFRCGFKAGLCNGVQFAAGKAGNGFRLNGSAYGFVPRSVFLDPGAGEGMTVECWVWPTNSASRQSLIEWSDNGLALRISESSPGSVYANLGIYNSSAYPLSSAGSLLRTNGWNHVGFTFESAGRQARLWLNGALVAEGTFPVPPATAGDVLLGSGSSSRLQGLLDEVSIYDRALSGAELQTIFNARTAGKCAVPEPPRFTLHPASRTVAPGEPVTFWAETLGLPPIQYQWLLNDVPLPGATNQGLTLASVQAVETGTYRVRATNIAGATVSTPATLALAPLQFEVVPNQCRDQNGYFGGNLAHAVYRKQQVYAAAHFPPGPITIHELRYRPAPWMGGPFSNTVPAIEFLLSTTAHPPGDLDTTYANNVGPDETVVFSGPLRLSSSFLTLSNGTKTFDIVIPLTTPFVYDPALGHLLVEARVSKAAAVTYIDTINPGDYGESVGDTDLTSPTARWKGCCTDILGVRYEVAPVPARILDPPRPATVYEGEPAAFSVMALGTRPLTYQWHFNGQPLPGQTEALLVLPNADQTDAGAYSVVVSNPLAQVTSSNALLTVLPPPPCEPAPSGLVAWWPLNGSLDDVIGGNTLQSSNPPVYIPSKVGQGLQFTTNGPFLELPASPLLDLGAGPGLTMEFWLNPGDKVAYMSLIDWVTQPQRYGVVVHLNVSDGYGSLYINLIDTNGGDHMLSTAAEVVKSNLLQHFAITYDQASGIARIYRNGVTVRTASLGTFRPETRYPVLIGRTLDDGWKFRGVLDELSFYRRALSEAEVAALYAAQVSGKCLTPPRPVIVTQPQGQTVEAGTTVQFNVSATGSQPLGYQWRFGGVPVTGATETSFVLPAATLAQAGAYSVAVSNEFGTLLSSNAVLSVTPAIAPPMISSFVPTAGPVGSTITILGANFAPVPDGNVVYFGPVRAFVNSATSNALIVTVPAGANYEPLTVTANRRTACANQPFRATFGSSRTLNPATFAPRLDLPTATWPRYPAVGDLDGDGRPDLVVCEENVNLLGIFQNDSQPGALTAASFRPRLDLGCAMLPFAVALADVDSDGRLDLVVAHLDGHVVSIFRNLATAPGPLTAGSFAPRLDLPVGASLTHIVVRDLDGDGRQDLSLARTDGLVTLLRNLNTVEGLSPASFSRQDYAIRAASLVVGDVDGDGRPDLLTGTDVYSVWRNRSTGYGLAPNCFEPKVSFTGESFGLALGDLDLDGKPDVAGAGWYGQELWAMRNTATPGPLHSGSYAPRAAWTTTGQPPKVTVGDLNGDGRPELATSTDNNPRLMLFQNQATSGTLGTGSFAVPVELPTDAMAYYSEAAAGVVIADLDLDGRPEVIFPNAWNNVLSIYRNLIPLQDPPRIVRQPVSRTVIPGEPIQFSVVATGTNPLRYQWLFAGNPLPGATQTALELNNVQPPPTGDFLVIVSNAFGAVTSLPVRLRALQPACTPVPSGIVAWWPAEGTGVEVIGTNQVQGVGAGSFAAGLVGQAFALAAESNALTVASSPELEFRGPFSVEGWVWMATTPGPQGFTLLAKGSGTNGLSDWELCVNSAGQLSATVTLEAGPLQVTGWSTLSTGAWQHVALVFTGTQLACYLNGYPDGWRGGTGTPRWSPLPLRLGLAPTGTAGKLDEFALYRSALTPLEIETLYNARYAGKCPLPPPLVTNLSVQDLTRSNAVLRGSVSSELAGAATWFDWGATTNYGNTTLPQWISGAASGQRFLDNLTGLIPGETYHYRTRATNYWGSSSGTDTSFRWQPSSPSVRALPPTSDLAVRLTFTGLPGHGYLVLKSTNLLDWHSVGMATEQMPGQFEYSTEIAPENPAQFYRLVAP